MSNALYLKGTCTEIDVKLFVFKCPFLGMGTFIFAANPVYSVDSEMDCENRRAQDAL